MSSATSRLVFGVLGKDCEMPEYKLPTVLDVLKYYLFLMRKGKLEKNKFPSFNEVGHQVVENVQQIWVKASIPTINSRAVLKRLKVKVEEYNNLEKSYKRDKDSVKYNMKKNIFYENIEKIFDIASCRCPSFDVCRCPVGIKVPELEQDFLLDQRSTRRMCIAGVDKKTTVKLQKKWAKKCSQLASLVEKDPTDGTSVIVESVDTAVTDSPDKPMFLVPSEAFDPSFPEPCTSKYSSGGKSKVQLNSFARACDRYGISDRSAATLASTLLHDLSSQNNLVTPIASQPDLDLVIDRSKVRRDRTKVQNTLQTDFRAKEKDIKCLYFDGRIDDTL